METVLEIVDLARSGAGLAREESGRAVFVPFTAPGDRVRVEIVSEEKRYAEARLLEVLAPSSIRVTPPCPVFGRCGGCEWQHLPYEQQWAAKKGGVAHAVKRVGVAAEVPWDELPAERIWEYRNRVQLRGSKDQIGFYARGSNELVPIEKCYIARPEINERIPEARLAGASRSQANAEGLAKPYKLELEVFPTGEVTESWNQGHSARGFRQVHDEQNEKLRAWVSAQIGSGGSLLDLYGGAGNLSLGLSDRFAEIHTVDLGAPIRTPDGAAPHHRFHRTSVLDWLRREQDRLRKGGPLRLVLDPPREGLGPELFAIVEVLKGLPLAETLLIGCETDPWANALARFQKHGWKLERLGALDFFPQTHHVEALAVLRRA